MMWENWNSGTLLMGVWNVVTLGKFGNFLKSQHTLNKCSSNSIPRYLRRKNENIPPHRDPRTNVYTYFICNFKKLDTNQMSVNGWMDKQIVEYPYNGILSSNKREWKADICNKMDEYQKSIMLSERRHFIIPFLWHSEKRKTLGTDIRSEGAKDWGRETDCKRAEEKFLGWQKSVAWWWW